MAEQSTDRDRHPSAGHRGSLVLSLLCVVFGTIALAVFAQTILESQRLSAPYVSGPIWQSLVALLGGQVQSRPGLAVAVIPTGSLFAGLFAISLLAWLVKAWWLTGENVSYSDALAAWGMRGWRWWLLLALWMLLWLLGLSTTVSADPTPTPSGLLVFLYQSSPMWVTLTLALTAAEWFALRREARPSIDAGDHFVVPFLTYRRCLFVLVALYVVTFTAMNWGLWFNLQIPHGDSAMYEEHLWNLEHGKGFRSYLDQGLFLGEHIQMVHVLLVPLHVLWPSHLLLELCESLALALTAIPVYWIAKRHTGSDKAAFYLATACLVGFPLQFLDISIDFKTFRPIAFGVPLLMFTIDQMERRRWKTMAILMLLTLSAKEDFAIPISLIGFWLAITGGGEKELPQEQVRQNRIIGASVWLLSAVYLFFAVKFAIPWFRDGATPHFARYFAKFGDTPLEILIGMLTNPGLLFTEIVDAPTFLYAAYLLVPLGFLPCLSPSRLATGVPLFGLLCLNELAQSPPGPFHHFHAPLLPILYWAAAAGLGKLVPKACLVNLSEPPNEKTVPHNTAICGARFALISALSIGVTTTLSPLGTRFWDTGRVVAERPTYWRALYLPDARAERWSEVEPLIPMDARVASTDFVHARLTHRARSYDYSGYARRVAGYGTQVPNDTDWIVLDLQHPYSQSVLNGVQSAADVREIQEQPEEWEVVEEATDEFFVVLQRVKYQE